MNVHPITDFSFFFRSGLIHSSRSPNVFSLAIAYVLEMIALVKDEGAIRADWAEVLKRRNCTEIYEYLYNVILNEDYMGDFTLDRKVILGLLKMARDSDLPCEPSPYENLKQDIEEYIEVYSKSAT